MADSQIDSELSTEGQKHAEELSEELKTVNPNVFFVSPLTRTRQTIQPFLNTLPNPTVVESDLLLERNLGDFTSTPMGAFQKYCDDNQFDKVTTRPANGESLADVYIKTIQFLNDIKSRYSGKTILVCGSKNNLMCLQIAIEGRDISDYYTFPSFKTGELRGFEIP
jgi:broad specificity phosphatase PhoE